MEKKAKTAEYKGKDHNSSDSECAGPLVRHALSANATTHLNSWIVDSGATCHMYNDSKSFLELLIIWTNYWKLNWEMAMWLTGNGIWSCPVEYELGCQTHDFKRYKLHDVLYVPKLSYNLFNVSKATKAGKTTEFSKTGCSILDVEQHIIAMAMR